MSRKAIVVTDDGVVDPTLEQLLQRHGYSRILQDSLTQALVAIEQNPIDHLLF
jgi:DNA-binding response OmpR family regulator